MNKTLSYDFTRIQFCWKHKPNNCDGLGNFVELRRLSSRFQSNCIEYCTQEKIYSMQ